jgi:hypothetical protein
VFGHRQAGDELVYLSIDKNECSYLNKIFEFWVPNFCRITRKEKFESANLGFLKKNGDKCNNQFVIMNLNPTRNRLECRRNGC